jgi:hypothetical protein
VLKGFVAALTLSIWAVEIQKAEAVAIMVDNSWFVWVIGKAAAACSMIYCLIYTSKGSCFSFITECAYVKTWQWVWR